MKYGYARVSSLIQVRGNSLEEQKNELIKAGVPEENIIIEQYSGVTTKRPKFSALMKRLQPGDELVCCKLDRFARTVESGLKQIRELQDKGITIQILNLNQGHPIDKSPMGRLTLAMMLAFAQFERDMIIERTAEGKAVARTKAGYREGRPPLDKARIDHAMELLKTHSIRQTAKMTNISCSSLIRYSKRERAKHLYKAREKDN